MNALVPWMLAGLLSAAEPSTSPMAGAGPRAEWLDESRGGSAGSVRDQLERDPTEVPFGKGAVFVPTMTDPLDEPPVSLWRAGKKVAEGTTGQRITVVPGHYQVTLGSGTATQQSSLHVQVEEQATTVVPLTWAGLVVHLVDERLNSVRNSYELIRVEDREYFGIGFGADEQAGEPVQTWLLPPGLYKLVRVGETYRARRDFATVRLQPGRLTHMMVVVDPDTGDFQGAGEVPADELFLAQRGSFWSALVVGGDLSLTTRRNTLGAQDGRTYSFRAFLDEKLSAQLFEHPLIVQLQIEEGQTKNPQQAWRKTQDRAALDALYVYRLFPWLGPYARLSVEANLLEGRAYFETPTDIRVLRESGELLRSEEDRRSLRLSPPLGFATFKEGAGMHVRLFKTAIGEATVRGGIGARHSQTRNLFEVRDDSATAALEYVEVPSTRQVGVEATLLATLRLTRWVLANLELDSLVPFEETREPVLELEGTLALKLTTYASFNYVMRFLRDRAVSPEDRIEQDLLLRFSLEVP